MTSVRQGLRVGGVRSDRKNVSRWAAMALLPRSHGIGVSGSVTGGHTEGAAVGAVDDGDGQVQPRDFKDANGLADARTERGRRRAGISVSRRLEQRVLD